jgi:hypothetical protein
MSKPLKLANERDDETFLKQLGIWGGDIFIVFSWCFHNYTISLKIRGDCGDEE